MDYRQKYSEWMEKAVEDKEIVTEMEDIGGDDGKIKERFYKELNFGTGGLRGIIGAGTNRMNIYTVRKATQGLCDYLNNECEAAAIAIAYDSRKNSLSFAQTAAGVCAANGIKVYLYEELMPTPMLSFAVRECACNAGIVITASHNPAKYNGYKVYGADGCQITLEAANKITDFIEAVDLFSDMRHMTFEAAVREGKVVYIVQQVIDRYFEEVLQCSMYTKPKDTTLKIVYSPLNGTGNMPVRRILNEIGLSDITVVQEQEKPDPEFTTCPYPNPEVQEALALGIELGRTLCADLVLATDPDCDRVGVAVKHDDDYVLINGNQMGVLLFDFICRMRMVSGTMPEHPLAVKTIVTSEIAQAVADAYGVELINVLTGFKFIGEQIGILEKKQEDARYIFGFEESYGYLSGTYVRDKDAVNAAMLIGEMTAYYREKNMDLVDALDALYKKYGYYFDKLDSFLFEGIDGMQRIRDMMKRVRLAKLESIGGVKVETKSDYWLSTISGPQGEVSLNFIKSDVIVYQLWGGSSVVIRPSGTEPKVKVYYSIRAKEEKTAIKICSDIERDMQELLKI